MQSSKLVFLTFFSWLFLTSFNQDHNQPPDFSKDLYPTGAVSAEVIDHKYFVSCMSTQYNIPLWVMHSLDASSVTNQPSRDRPDSPKYPHSPEFDMLPKDAYTSSGYDHGHLAPAADFKYSADAYRDSHYMTNMSPQHGCFNQVGWCQLEGLTRKWAQENPESDFFVISGSVTVSWIDKLCFKSGSDDIEIFVPKYYYKVIAEHTNGKFIRGTAFLVPNEYVPFGKLPSTVRTIDDIEEITGLDFFPNISEEEEAHLEGVSANYTIYMEKQACPEKTCEKVYAGPRYLPEDRTKKRCN